MSNFTFPSFNISIFTKKDGATINNEDRKEFKMLKFTQFCNFFNFVNFVTKNCSSGISEAGDFLNMFLKVLGFSRLIF